MEKDSTVKRIIELLENSGGCKQITAFGFAESLNFPFEVINRALQILIQEKKVNRVWNKAEAEFEYSLINNSNKMAKAKKEEVKEVKEAVEEVTETEVVKETKEVTDVETGEEVKMEVVTKETAADKKVRIANEKAEAKAKKEAEKVEKEANRKPKGPGVIASILEVITDATAPVAQSDILAVLAERFPEKDEKSMTNTIRAQIGSNKRP